MIEAAQRGASWEAYRRSDSERENRNLDARSRIARQNTGGNSKHTFRNTIRK